jgi:hypothetical protein
VQGDGKGMHRVHVAAGACRLVELQSHPQGAAVTDSIIDVFAAFVCDVPFTLR